MNNLIFVFYVIMFHTWVAGTSLKSQVRNQKFDVDVRKTSLFIVRK